MALAEFIWDHAPKQVQDWMDRRELTPDSRYEPFKEDLRPRADTQVGPRSAEELRQSGDINLDSTDGMRTLAQALADPDGQKFEAARGNPPRYFKVDSHHAGNGETDMTHDERRRQQHEAAATHWQKKIDQERGQQSATTISANQQRTETHRQQGELEVEPEKRGRSRSP